MYPKFYLHNQSRETEVRMVDPCEGVLPWMGPGEAFEMLEVFSVLIWMAITQVCASAKIHQTTH